MRSLKSTTASGLCAEKMTLQAIIIDLDGTMVNTLGDFNAVLNLTLRELHLPRVSVDFIERTIGQGTAHLIRSTLIHVGSSIEIFETALTIYHQHYQKINGQYAPVYPGVFEGLRAFQAQGLKLACLTNKPLALAQSLLTQKGLSPFFQAVFGGDSFERQKPHPLPLLKTCEALGTLPANTLMVGDSSNDAQAARAAGCPVVLVSYGYNHGKPATQGGADGVVDRLDEIKI
jgi:phosphoglycolate phosphatase